MGTPRLLFPSKQRSPIGICSPWPFSAPPSLLPRAQSTSFVGLGGGMMCIYSCSRPRKHAFCSAPQAASLTMALPCKGCLQYLTQPRGSGEGNLPNSGAHTQETTTHTLQWPACHVYTKDSGLIHSCLISQYSELRHGGVCYLLGQCEPQPKPW